MKIFALSELDCIAMCVVDECCRSTNYNKTANIYDGEENCEILYDEFLEEDLVEDENYDYLVLRQPHRVKYTVWPIL